MRRAVHLKNQVVAGEILDFVWSNKNVACIVEINNWMLNKRLQVLLNFAVGCQKE